MFLSPGPLLLTLTFKGMYKPHCHYADVTRDYKEPMRHHWHYQADGWSERPSFHLKSEPNWWKKAPACNLMTVMRRLESDRTSFSNLFHPEDNFLIVRTRLSYFAHKLSANGTFNVTSTGAHVIVFINWLKHNFDSNKFCFLKLSFLATFQWKAFKLGAIKLKERMSELGAI